jgi:hypothetical protein
VNRDQGQVQRVAASNRPDPDGQLPVTVAFAKHDHVAPAVRVVAVLSAYLGTGYIDPLAFFDLGHAITCGPVLRLVDLDGFIRRPSR